MAKARLGDAEFIDLFKEVGATELSKRAGVNVRTVFRRRDSLEQKYGCAIEAPASKDREVKLRDKYPQRVHLAIKNGVVLVGSDAHYWPGSVSTAHRALVKFTKYRKPTAVVLNGDVLDFPQISRHPPIGWDEQPTVQEELENAQERLHEIEKAAPKGCELVWTAGNHDIRFETRLATVAPEFAKLNGFRLKDWFPLWRPCWSVWVNDDVVIKHRSRGGIHAPHNNALWAGKTIVTGHLHSAKVIPLTDYNGTRYGVDTGCLADTDAKAFTDYTEDNPKNWRSAFGVLTFKDGKLLMPELVLVWDEDHVQFRGEIISV